MWVNSLLMAVIGLSAGFTVAAGLGAFMIELGVKTSERLCACGY